MSAASAVLPCKDYFTNITDTLGIYLNRVVKMVVTVQDLIIQSL